MLISTEMGGPTYSSFVGALVISCLAGLCLSNNININDPNPITLISDGLTNFQSTSFSIMDHILDHLSFTSFISPPIEAIYQFGDSISDTGNYAHDQPLSNFNQFPYGETYFHRPAGRCSDGLLMVDYFAKFLKLPLLDAYLNKDGNFTHGVNFAVTGASALNDTRLVSKYNVVSTTTNHSLSVQLGWFKSHLNSICSNASECKKELAKGLFLMGEIGGNDYNFVFFQGKPISIAYQMVPEVVDAIRAAIKEIINLGATRIVVPGNFPVGCMTVFLAIFKSNDATMYDDHKCLKYLNKFAKYHNNQLQKAIRGLEKDYPNATIVYADYYTAFTEALQHPPYHGFERSVIHRACCGEGDNEYNFNFGRLCGNKGVPACENPQHHISWDGIHLTQHAYRVMANWLMRNILYGLTHVS
ncbi:GDSL esterase/lipase At5g03980-like isoform X2 [Silene latifolia]|uniref:GDSL esterase/lipase At5g03980-like isoform X2 n=1 Tax=Silene latifolia TaxID=37657 RepID=UPI003D78421E